jgi:hypothetical protein
MDAATLGNASDLRTMMRPTGTVELTEWNGTSTSYTRGDSVARFNRLAQAIPHWEIADQTTCSVFDPEGAEMECTIGGGGTYYKMFWRRPEKAESEATARWFLYRILGEHH